MSYFPQVEILDSSGVNKASVSAAGAVKVDGSAVTQPVSGTVGLSAGQAVELLDSGGTNKASISAAGAVKVDGSAVTQPVSLSAGQAVELLDSGGTNKASISAAGAVKVDGSAVTQPVSGTVTANAGTGPSTAWKVDLSATGANATAVKVDGSAVTQPVSGTVTANQGTPNTAANAWPHKVTDGTNTAAVKAASTAPVAADPSLVVTMSPNSPSQSDQVTGSTALGALNATIQVALAGQQTVGFNLAAGTLIGTIIPEISYDGGTTWVQTEFADLVHNTYFPQIVFAASNTAQNLTIDAGGGCSHARVRVSAFTSGTANATMRAVMAVRSMHQVAIIDGTKATFAAATGATATAGTGVVLQIQGSATKTVRVTRIHVVGFAATAAQATFKIQRASTAATSGTSATLTAAQNDKNDPAATAVVTHWTATGGTAGTSVGGPHVSDSVWLPSSTFAAATGSEADRGWTWGTLPGTREIVLRGTTDFLTLTCSGTLAASQVWIEWTEE